MTTNEMKKVLADKLADEQTGFTFKDISIAKAKMPMTTEWDEEKDDWKVEMVPAIRVIISGFEHFHFFIIKEVDEYFGNSVWVYGKHYYADTKEYSNEGSEIVFDTYGKNTDFERLTNEALLNLGYYIATRF